MVSRGSFLLNMSSLVSLAGNLTDPVLEDGSYNHSGTGGAPPNLSTYHTPLDEDELMEAYLGSRYRGKVESVILTVVYSIIFLTGVIGNVSTCIVITTNSYMHTATNFYLFSLAISDMLTLILGLPPELYTVWEAYPWRLGEPYCLLKTFLTEMTSSASVLTITAFTVERYVAICHPMRAQTMFSLPRAIKITLFIWVAACLTALPYPIHARTYHYVTHPDTNEPVEDSLICNIPPEWMPRMRHVFQLSTFILFVLPMALITALYILIGITLRKSGLARQTSDSIGTSPSGPTQSRRAVLKMLVAVVVAFFICWAPYHAQRLMTVYVRDDAWTETLLEIQSMLFYCSGILYFVSSTVNPILYNLMSRKYRQAFKDTLCRCCMSPDERRYNEARMRGYTFSERSTTYMTVAGGANSRLHSVREPNTPRSIAYGRPSGDYGLKPASGDSFRQLKSVGSWKDRLLANGGRGRDSSYSSMRLKQTVPNGGVYSDSSPGSSPSHQSSMKTSPREEIELESGVYKPPTLTCTDGTLL